jgi:hypothetical protein
LREICKPWDLYLSRTKKKRKRRESRKDHEKEKQLEKTISVHAAGLPGPKKYIQEAIKLSQETMAYFS